MNRSLPVLIATALLAGCASLEPNIKEGQEYAGRFPVLYHGTVKDFQYEDEAGTVHSFAKETADTLATGAGSIGSLASMGTGLSSAGGGLVVGLVGVFVDAIAASNAPAPPQIVLQKSTGEYVKIPAPNVYMERAIKFHCLDIDEPVKVVDDGTPYLYVMHEDPRLHRRTAFEPSCESLREKYNVPLNRQVVSAN